MSAQQFSRRVQLTYRLDPEATTATDDALEKAEAHKDTGAAAQDGIKGEEALNAAIGDDGDDVDPEITSGADDALEKAEATKESR